jgi:hypothetical protein
MEQVLFLASADHSSLFHTVVERLRGRMFKVAQ